MKPHQLPLRRLLPVVPQHCTVPDLATHLGCDPKNVRRRLRQAEMAELVELTKVGQFNVVELTPKGRAYVERHGQ